MSKDKKKVVYQLPKHVLDIIKKSVLNEPLSVIETDFYTIDAVNLIIEKNSVIWTSRYYGGYYEIMKEAIIKFNDTSTYLYLVRKVDETIFKFFIMYPPDSHDSVIFYLNTLKKYKTI